MLKHFAFFLILNLGMFAISCATKPTVTTKFDGQWQFVRIGPNENMACLNQRDVEKLREILIRCDSRKE